MKSVIIKLLIIPILFGCTQKRNAETDPTQKNGIVEIVQENSNKSELTIREKEQQIRDKINAEFDANIKKCHHGINSVTNFNGKKEFWNICKLDNGNRIIRIESHKDSTLFSEIYFEKKGELTYAYESENYMPENHYTIMPWNCEFYIENGKIVALMSLGHGKTEDDEWDPNSIFGMYKARLSQLVKIKKE